MLEGKSCDDACGLGNYHLASITLLTNSTAFFDRFIATTNRGELACVNLAPGSSLDDPGITLDNSCYMVFPSPTFS